MTHLTPIRLDDGTIIYMETTGDIDVSAIPSERLEEEELVERGSSNTKCQEVVTQDFQAIQKTIFAYTNYTLNAFRQVASANVDKVKLEFGLEIGAEVGIPYITRGTGSSNIKVTVECSFPATGEQEHIASRSPDPVKKLASERL